MRAQVIRCFGPPSVFKQEDIPVPKIQPNQILIRVKASSMNPIDCKIRSGLVPSIAPAFPAVLHGDVAGIVAEVGSRVSGFKEGDEVYACAGGVKGTGGALAEYMAADGACVAHKPKTFSFAEAAALPLVTITAWTALFLKAKIQPGCRLLVHGGVGGVGHIAIQLAHWAGAQVTATVGSEEDFAIAHKLGSKNVINFRTEPVTEYVQRITQNQGFEVIFDTVGGKNLDLSFQAAALNGTIATTAARSTNDLSPLHEKGLSLHVVFMLIPLLIHQGLQEQGEILQKAAHLADAGKLKPLIDPQLFTFSEAAKAHEYLESGRAKGKIVLICD